MKQTAELIHRDLFIPIYEQTPLSLKTKLLLSIGFKMRVSNFYQRKFITQDQYESMLAFKDEHELMKPNTVGEPVAFDLEQVEKYNAQLLKLISSMGLIKKDKDLNAQRRRLETEQIIQQKRINEHKRSLTGFIR